MTRFANPPALKAAVIALVNAAIAAGTLPKVKLTYSAIWVGCTPRITVTIRGLTGFVNAEHVEAISRGVLNKDAGERYTVEARAIRDAIVELLATINYDKSDYHSDYYDVGFYSDVLFDRKAEDAERARMSAPTHCLACGATLPITRLVDPDAPSRVALVDAGRLARIAAPVDAPATTASEIADALLDEIARAPRYYRCPGCAALTRVGTEETLVPGPTDGPTQALRRVYPVALGRAAFEAWWSGACVAAVIEGAELVVGDVLRMVEQIEAEHYDAATPPRYVLGLVTHVEAHAGGERSVLASTRHVGRGSEPHGLEERRGRLIAALADAAYSLPTTAALLDASVAEVKQWIRALGLEDMVSRSRSRVRKGGARG